MFTNDVTTESANRVMNPAEVQLAYELRVKQLREEGTRHFHTFTRLRAEACREANRRTKEIKESILRLELELIAVAEKRTNLIHDARHTYEARCIANREAREEARMNYMMQMAEAKNRKNALPDGE